VHPIAEASGEWVLKMNYARTLCGRLNPLSERFAFISTITSKSFFKNDQVHPHGIEYSTQLITAVLLTIQPKVFNRVLLLSADFGRRKIQP